MNLAPSERAQRLREELLDFMEHAVRPAEPVYREQLRAAGDPHAVPPVMEELKREARSRGLWNLFLPHETRWGGGLSNVDYAPLAEISGMSPLAPEAMNCSAPDTGNMELLALFGTEEQQERWLAPLMDGEIRSCFMMTEPDVASSDATNISCRIERDGDEYVINGRKWWTTGAADPRCRIGILLGVTDPGAEPHRRHSMVLIPTDTPGVTVVRDLHVFGYNHRESHCEIRLEDVRVPREHLLGREGEGFRMAQARLGPGRIHHCMRAIGRAERALELLCRRALERRAFGRTLAEHGVVGEWIAESRIEIDQARLLTLRAAWLIDTAGAKAAAKEISAIKVAAMRAALRTIDRAIQAHGGAGVSQDTPLAEMYAETRALMFADGPDEVHRRALARHELRAYRDGAPSGDGRHP